MYFDWLLVESGELFGVCFEVVVGDVGWFGCGLGDGFLVSDGGGVFVLVGGLLYGCVG